MFINKLNQLYKPKRIMYYVDADENAVAAFFFCSLPEEVGRNTNKFGTYDYPGIFYVKSLGKPVIGIEFRSGDEHVDYPLELKSVDLDEAFFYSIEIDNEIEINIDSINGIFRKIREDDDAHRNYSDLSVREDPEVISVFLSGKKIRILYEMQVDKDRAADIIRDEYDT